ncbi:MAG: hypothetical protein ACRDPD_09100 [Streptosporangiaceae bacterium]
MADLLWTQADELPDAQAITGLLGIIVGNGQLDQAKATAWGFVRTIDYWLWGLENGLTIDPVRCQRIAAALAPWPSTPACPEPRIERGPLPARRPGSHPGSTHATRRP